MTGQASNRVSRSARAMLLGSLAASLLLVASGCTRVMPGAVDASTTGVASLRQDFELGRAAVKPPPQVVPEPTGDFARLSGRFLLKGDLPPPLAALSVDKDFTVCAADGNPSDESLVFDRSTRALANVMIYAQPKGYDIPVGNEDWEHEEYRNAQTLLSGAAGFDQKDCVFTSHVFAMRSFQTLELINSDSVLHSTKWSLSVGQARSANESVPPNETVTYEPKNKSRKPFQVSCGTHGWMKAWMHVMDHPFFSISKKDGSFEVKHVPCGVPLPFKIWHEASGRLTKVTVNGQETPLKNGVLELESFTTDEDRVLEIEIEVSNFTKL